MFWDQHVPPAVQSWLLEHEEPSVRYLARRDLLGLPSGDPELLASQQDAHQQGAIPAILDQMHPDGYWVGPDDSYNPKYRASVWSLLTLAQLGASAALDERLHRACAYLVEHFLAEHGQFTTSGAPSTTADCLQGNLSTVFLDLGYDDPRLETAFDWLARSVTGEGIAPPTDRQAEVRYYAGNYGPRFACGANNKNSCAWGGVKVMLALSKIPSGQRTPAVQRAIAEGVDFLLGTNPALALYPTPYEGQKPSGNWWKFGFPVYYVTDLLQNVEALVALGYGADPRLADALQIIRDKQDEHGCWALEYDYLGKTWVDFGQKKQPNPWVSIRALKVLKAASGS